MGVVVLLELAHPLADRTVGDPVVEDREGIAERALPPRPATTRQRLVEVGVDHPHRAGHATIIREH